MQDHTAYRPCLQVQEKPQMAQKLCIQSMNNMYFLIYPKAMVLYYVWHCTEHNTNMDLKLRMIPTQVSSAPARATLKFPVEQQTRKCSVQSFSSLFIISVWKQATKDSRKFEDAQMLRP